MLGRLAEQIEPHTDRPPGLEAGVDGAHPDEALEQKGGSDQQGQTQRDLGHHEGATQASPLASAQLLVASALESAAEVRAQELP